MHSIKQVGNILGISKNQVRTRLNLLRPWFNQFIRRGEKNKILIKDSGVEVLRRFQQLEKNADSLQVVAEEIKQEQLDRQETSTKEEDNLTQTDLNKTQTSLLEEKERQIKRLEEENNYLKNQLERKDDRIQQLLPGRVEEEEKKDEFKDLGLIQVIKKWFTTKT